MRYISLRRWALLAVLGATLLWNCRGKEGPQGPAGPQGPSGQNLTRTQQGYIRGTVKGRDTVRNQNFQLDFDYTYVPTFYNIPGFWFPITNAPDTIQIILTREGEKGGYLSLALQYWRSNGNSWVSNLDADILNVSSSQAQRYQTYYSGWGVDTAYVTNLSLSGDTLISGKLFYIKRSKSIPDTLMAELQSRLFRFIPYQRQGQNSSRSLINLANPE